MLSRAIHCFCCYAAGTFRRYAAVDIAVAVIWRLMRRCQLPYALMLSLGVAMVHYTGAMRAHMLCAYSMLRDGYSAVY